MSSSLTPSACSVNAATRPARSLPATQWNTSGAAAGTATVRSASAVAVGRRDPAPVVDVGRPAQVDDCPDAQGREPVEVAGVEAAQVVGPVEAAPPHGPAVDRAVAAQVPEVEHVVEHDGAIPHNAD